VATAFYKSLLFLRVSATVSPGTTLFKPHPPYAPYPPHPKYPGNLPTNGCKVVGAVVVY
jgi:hypothetical protein